MLENLNITDAKIGIFASGLASLELQAVTSTFNSMDGLTVSTAGSVKIDGGEFSHNSLAGITLSGVGAVELLDGVEASSNTESGLDITSYTSVRIAGGTFNSNGMWGIAIDLSSSSIDTVQIEGVEANANLKDGLEVTRSGDVIVINSTFSDNFDNGIQLREVSDIQLDDVTAERNVDAGILVRLASSLLDTDGIYKDNDDHGLALFDVASDITLHRTEADNNDANFDLTGDGLHVSPDVTPFGAGGNLTILGGLFRDTDGPGIVSNQMRGIYAAEVGGTASLRDSFHVVQSVLSTGNAADGVFLDVGVRAEIVGGTFDSNGDNGLRIVGYHRAELTNVTATMNTLHGVSTFGTPDVEVSGGTYDLNGFHGLNIEAAGMLVVDQGDGLTANLNALNGLNAMGIGMAQVRGGSYNMNAGKGLRILGAGDVTFSDSVTATGNLTGVHLTDVMGFIDSDGVFTSNDDHGILLEGIHGHVILKRTTADDNDADFDGTGDGVHAVSTMPGMPAIGGGGLNVFGGSFSDTDGILAGANQQTGIFVSRTPAAFLVFDFETGAGVTATGNVKDGVRIGGGMFVTFNQGNYSSNRDDGIDLTGISTAIDLAGVMADLNADDGLSIASSGTVNADDSTFDLNGGDGVDLDTVGNVFFRDISGLANGLAGVDVNRATSFGDDSGSYLLNDDHGIRLTDITADVTLVSTISENNDADTDGTGDGLNATATALPAAIGGDLSITDATMNGTFGSQFRGVAVASVAGTMSINGSTFIDHDSHGAFVSDGGTSAAINTSTFSTNGGDGLRLHSFSSAVTLDAVTASGNSGDGIHLEDLGGGPLEALGPAIFGNLTAIGNGKAGYTAIDASSVTGTNSILKDNHDHGIFLQDITGNVSLTSVTANDNDGDNDNIGDGLHATTPAFGTAIGGTLTVTGGSFSDTDDNGSAKHQENGVFVDRIDGGVFMINVTASGNDQDGVDIDDGSQTAVPFSGPGLSGNYTAVFRGGNYNQNNDEGIRLFSFGGTIHFGVNPIVGGSTPLTANNNQTEGIELDQIGNVELFDVQAKSNQIDGLNISVALDVTVTGGDFSHNNDNGIEAFLVGNVSISDVLVDDTGSNILPPSSGIVVDTATSLTLSNITVTNSTLHGVEIDSVSTVTLMTSTGKNVDSVTVDQTTISHTRDGVAQDAISYTGVTALNLNTGDSDDDMTVQFAGTALPTITVTGGEQAFSDVLTVVRNQPSDAVTVTAATITDGTSMIHYSQIEKVVVDAGDFSFGGGLGLEDIDALVNDIAAGNNTPQFELTGDRFVNGDDLDRWLELAGAANLASGNAYLLGDANLDGTVDGSDFNQWNAHKFTSGNAWSGGDFNADGVTDGSDFNIWNARKFTSADGGSRPSNVSGLVARPFSTADHKEKKVPTALVDLIFAQR